jgi:hypothetical protein
MLLQLSIRNYTCTSVRTLQRGNVTNLHFGVIYLHVHGEVELQLDLWAAASMWDEYMTFCLPCPILLTLGLSLVQLHPALPLTLCPALSSRLCTPPVHYRTSIFTVTAHRCPASPRLFPFPMVHESKPSKVQLLLLSTWISTKAY